MGSGRISLFSSVVASICIIIYIAAIVFGAVQITLSMNSRRALAEQEFFDLADRASSAAILGFMSDAYQLSMMDALEESRTILGLIISGSNGQYGFERRQGSVISWVGDSPRFKPGFGLPSEPYHRVISISGQRNGTIQAQYSLIDYDVLLNALRNTLTVILGALALAIFALIIEIAVKNRSRYYESAVPEKPYYEPAPQGISQATVQKIVKEAVQEAAASLGPPENLSQRTAEDFRPESPVPVSAPAEQSAAKDSVPPENNKPQGLYSPRSNVGWESYTKDRLDSELHRCASSEQDLVFLNIEHDGENESNPLSDDSLYRKLADETLKFFTQKDLIFEKGKYGLAVIVPGMGLEQGMAKSEEFLKRVKTRFPGVLDTGLCIGLSSRSGRLVEAERFIFESSVALQKAKEDRASSIVGFKSDPQKYREFISLR